MIQKIIQLLMISFLTVVPAISQEVQEATPKIYEVKYRDVGDIYPLLLSLDRSLVSAGSVNPAFNTITVTADEKGHALVADVIRKYDVPFRTVEFQFFLIKANPTGDALEIKLPDKVRNAVKEVASLMRYQGFELIDAPFLRIQETRQPRIEHGINGKGIYNYSITINDLSVGTEGDTRFVKVGGFNIVFNIPSPDGTQPQDLKDALRSRVAELSTPFSISEGEIVVLGASQVESRKSGNAIITVVSAKVL
jgi:hypothetical protein